MRQKTSPIWKISKEELILLVQKSNSISEILRYFGLVNKGHNYKTLKSRLLIDNIDDSEVKERSNKNRKRGKPVLLEHVLVTNSAYNRHHLKKRLIKNKLIEEKCAICGLLPIWNNQKLTMILDHINGIYNDSRIENLRLICPNCNSQTKTFAGRNVKHETKIKSIDKRHKPKFHLRKIIRPDLQTLLEETKEHGFRATGRKYGVRDSTVKKWIKFYLQGEDAGIPDESLKLALSQDNAGSIPAPVTDSDVV